MNNETALNRVVKHLRELVSRGSSPAAAAYAADVLKKAGFAVTLQPVPGGECNVLAEAGSGEKCLLWLGHTDVVPAGDPALWDSDPFTLSERDGKYYGRGACDMKGSIACLLALAEECKPEQLPYRLRIVLDAAEETDNAGLLTYLEAPFAADGAIVGEPSRMEVDSSHRGVTHWSILIKGQKCHASQAPDALNPNLFAARFILACEAIKRGITPGGGGSVGVTMIRSGDAQNTVPETCEVTLDVRLIPGETAGSARAALEEKLRETALLLPGFSWEMRQRSFSPAHASQDGELLRKALRIAEEILGSPQKQEVFTATCEAGWIADTVKGPVIIWGAGSLEQAHAVNEFITEEQLRLGYEGYKALLFGNRP